MPYIQVVTDDDLERLLSEYLDQRFELDPAMAGVRIEWIEGNPAVGALHIWEKHGVSRQEVEEVLLELPPHVEARRHRGHPRRTVFWGATRGGRWLLVPCEDRTIGGHRILTPITAFEPDEGEDYWRKQ